jgi:hypothetical protein
MVELCVSLQKPHMILAVGGSQRRIMGYKSCDLDGRPFTILQGPKTDLKIQECAMMNTQTSGISSDFFLVLYDAALQPHDMAVSCSLHPDVNGHSCCCLTLQLSGAVCLQDVFLETSCAWALTASEWPYFVSVINNQFICEFGLSGSDIVGQTLHRIKPLHTESTVWRRLLKMASEGRRVQDSALTRSHFGIEKLTALTCTPVVDASGSKVEFVMVRFSPGADPSAASAGPADPPPLFAPSGSAAASPPTAAKRRGAPRVGRPTAPAPDVIDDAYVKRIQRRLRIAERRAAAGDNPADALACAAAAPPPPGSLAAPPGVDWLP